MFRWFGLVGLRMKTIAVVELDYRRKLDIAGGADTELFNKTTRLARDVGGNEYDAAAMFLTSDTAVRLSEGSDSTIGLIDLLQITNQRMHLMKRPDVVNDMMERAFSAVDG
jgi:hypothetical protein